MPVIYFTMLFTGVLAGTLLLWRIPRLKDGPEEKEQPNISIIIPARDEEKNIGNLLEDLQKQQVSVLEIICVDDGSTDGTAEIIQQYGVGYLPIKNKPEGWTGKTYACQTGGLASKGELLIFIDADVRMGPDMIGQIAARCKNKVVSVQPYHRVTKLFEHFAFFFNAVGIAANGAACPFSKKKAGLFGPVIAMTRKDFDVIDGFNKVRTSVIEDVELGQVIEDGGLEYSLFVGDENLSFRMYQSFRELFLGFTKNYSSGAAKTPFLLLVLSFLWLMALTAAPIAIIEGAVFHKTAQLVAALALYGLFVVQLIMVAPKIGSFKRGYLIVYPVFLMVFHFVFVYSLYAKIFIKKVSWKGRDISLEK